MAPRTTRLFDAGKISGTACLNVGGRLLETDSQGRVVYAHKPGQMIVDECNFGAGADARSLTGAQLVQVTLVDGGADCRSD